MKNLLIVLGLVVVIVVGLGFYRGWFAVAWDRADGKGHLTGTLDEGKFRSDEKKALEAVQGLGHPSKETAASSSGDGKKEVAPVEQLPGR